MKRILITGANSFIGTTFERFMSTYAKEYQVDTVDMIDGTWREKDFSKYDVVFHVAGIAHSDTGKIKPEKEALYRKVNTDLTIETAKKAKNDGVKQFIFMSSEIVYGKSAGIGKQKIITKDTKPEPENCYGDSKLQAELGITPLASDSFKVVILRPPMIYGKGGKGNFLTLEKFAKKYSIFPKIKNERSMLYVGNLVEFIKLMIDNDESGTFYPQNAEYSNTSELARMIREANGKKMHLLRGFGPLLKLLSHVTGLVNKAFGNLVYDQELSKYKVDYCKYSLKESVEQTESVE